jgi:hypothetical protein
MPTDSTSTLTLASQSPQARLLYLITAIGPGCDLDTLDETLLNEGLQAHICRIVNPVTAGEPVRVHLTAHGLQRSLELQKGGHLLIGTEITRHGLSITHDLSMEQWRSMIERLRLVKECYHTALSDAIRYGRTRFGNDIVDQTIEQLQFPFADITHAESIGEVPRLLRETYSLTAEHYYILGLLFPGDTTSQEMWAQRTVEHHLSPIALRRSIETGQILTDEALKQRTGNGSGIHVLQAVSLPFTRWTRSIGGLDGVKKLKRTDQIAILDELTPIVEFALELRQQAFPEEESEA